MKIWNETDVLRSVILNNMNGKNHMNPFDCIEDLSSRLKIFRNTDKLDIIRKCIDLDEKR